MSVRAVREGLRQHKCNLMQTKEEVQAARIVAVKPVPIIIIRPIITQRQAPHPVIRRPLIIQAGEGGL